MNPWAERPALEIDRSLPKSKWFDAAPEEAVEAAKKLLAAIDKEIPHKLRLVADLARIRTQGRFHGEISRCARRFGIDWRTLMLANISYDLMLVQLGCSTLAASTADGPVLARNMDWWPEKLLARATYHVVYPNGGAGKPALQLAGWPGAVGVVTGMSEGASGNGFAIALNAVSSVEPIEKFGYPVMLLIRKVLEDARDFDEAVAELANTRIPVGALFTVVGTENHQRVCIERSPRKHALRWPEADDVLVVTNEYRMFDDHKGVGVIGDLQKTACWRFDRLTELMASHRPRQSIDDDALLFHLTDPEVKQGITAQHVIMRPVTQHMHVAVPWQLVEG